MKIALFFASPFSVLSAFTKPLGGSESAVTYLAIELVKRGHDVTLITLNPDQVSAFGVRGLSMSIVENRLQFPKELEDEVFDAYIFKNSLLDFGPYLKRHIPEKAKLFFWTGHADDQPAIQALSSPEVQDAFTGFVAVSDWQKEQFVQKFSIDPAKIFVIRNAISPHFQNLFTDEEDFRKAKEGGVGLVYTSTPFRGLELLLQQFPIIQEKEPSVHLSVYSSMNVYGVDEKDDLFHHLYELAHTLSNISYVGSLIQPELAKALRFKHILAYPNTFLETSCIAVMEAMAAGLWVVSTNQGALPETALGYGDLVEPDLLIGMDENGFLSKLISSCKRVHSDQMLNRLFEQVQEVNSMHTWANRANSWEKLLQ